MLAIHELCPTRLLSVDATDMVLNPGEIRRIGPDDIAEMFMMTTRNMPLYYLVEQVRKDVGAVQGLLEEVYQSLADRDGAIQGVIDFIL